MSEGEDIDEGACDPSDDECGWCGFPTFDCKCPCDDCEENPCVCPSVPS